MENPKRFYDIIKQLELENVSKMFPSLQVNDEQDMFSLPFCPDVVINKAKSKLGLFTNPGFDSALYPGSLPPAIWDSPPTQITSGYGDSHSKGNDLEFLKNQMQSLNMKDRSSDFFGSFSDPEQWFLVGTNRETSKFPSKVCKFFNEGICKYGNRCWFNHTQFNDKRENYSRMYYPNLNEEDDVISPDSLGKLESEIIELLKSRRRSAVSIASLPMLYREKYGKPLQAKGYVTESQRQVKPGYGLTTLLDRLSNNIRRIDRSHGQHLVILAEDLPNFSEYSTERKKQGGLVPASRKIYLTFPAKSTFTEQDVSNYFSKFGLVDDVSIPYQEKRMYGFVTFASSSTVEQILFENIPHFIRRCHVLAKPYKDKSALVNRKFVDKVQHGVHYESPYMDRDAEMKNPSGFDIYSTPCFRCLTDDMKLASENADHGKRSDFMLGALETESIADDRIWNIRTNNRDTNSQELNLPDQFSGI